MMISTKITSNIVYTTGRDALKYACSSTPQFTFVGQWHEGLVVSKNEIVTMGDEYYACLVDKTSEPPVFTMKDKNGNRLTTKSGDYFLTDKNMAQYGAFNGVLRNY